ncbi:MAG TPA: hypothetical protein DIT93_08680 [Pelagibacterium sp.]|jgi:hypothetical protein|nr:hypothetical protein [Pelagibacterium sp.]HCO55078.1 hypothetical protein [Pelagibacterium sp.]|tara:strand:+ start:3143 stop:3412 length:270 start_codon:yes stop_codon:yes gene_type:complete
MPNVSGGGLNGQVVASLAIVAALVWGLAWLLPIIVRALRTGVIEGRSGFYDRKASGGMYALTLGVFVVMALLFILGLAAMIRSILVGIA